MARTRNTGGNAGGLRELRGRSFKIPGLYQRLLEHEREVELTPDPRWRYSAAYAAEKGGECPPKFLRHSRCIRALEAGEPVQLPGWTRHAGHRFFPQLGAAIPGLNEKCTELRGQDRLIGGFLVYADDTLVPTRRR